MNKEIKKKTKGEKILIISVIVIAVIAIVIAICEFVFKKNSEKKFKTNDVKITSKVKANNDIIDYDDLFKKINKDGKRVYVTKCDCSGVEDFDTYNNATCKVYEVDLKDAGTIIDKIKENDFGEEVITSIACSKYEFDIQDEDNDSIIYGFTGDNEESILVSYDDNGYGFMFNDNLSDFFENIIAGKRVLVDEPYTVTEKKPILYLYPKKDKTKVTVSFGNPKVLKTTYPKYKDKWVVTANKNGDLTDDKGNYYYALYWEEKQNTKVDFKTGFYVTKNDAITFLEDKLKYIGLNDKERNEFIMYWLPILEKNKKSVVYFELTEDRDEYNELIIDPKPDSVLRISMHVKKVDKKPKNLEKQKLSNFKRKGFVAVEWGGVIHK